MWPLRSSVTPCRSLRGGGEAGTGKGLQGRTVFGTWRVCGISQGGELAKAPWLMWHCRFHKGSISAFAGE